MSEVDQSAESEPVTATLAATVTPTATSEDVRFAKLEGRVHSLEGRVEQLMAVERGRKQRALYYRLALLALMLLAFFLLRSKQGNAP